MESVVHILHVPKICNLNLWFLKFYPILISKYEIHMYRREKCYVERISTWLFIYRKSIDLSKNKDFDG